MRYHKNLDYFKLLFEKVDLSSEAIQNYARTCEFEKRIARKITPEIFLSLFLTESLNEYPSYNDLAARLEAETGISTSKQAICQRVNSGCVEFMQTILEHIMKMKLTYDLSSYKSRYERVIVQDSTVIGLPQRLFNDYSGVGSATKKSCNARIQVAYDLISGNFISLSIDPYSKNDLASAGDLKYKENDLVLRDRGYLSNKEVQRHIDLQADCIYRHKANSVYIDPESNEQIDLLSILDKQNKIDKVVQLNNCEGTICRLVAMPVNEETANIRRMKLKKEIKGHKPSKKQLKLMSWTIFLTTIPKDKVSFDELLELYGLRWRIEVVFKIWKSHMNFASIHNVSKKQLKVLVTARLSVIVLFTHFIYKPLGQRIRKEYNREISLTKTTKYLVNNLCKITQIVEALYSKVEDENIFNIMIKYCAYDKRKRPSF